jgi:hypothetical protein
MGSAVAEAERSRKGRSDVLRATDCALPQGVHDHGMTVAFTTVPYPNGGTAESLTLNLTR